MLFDAESLSDTSPIAGLFKAGVVRPSLHNMNERGYCSVPVDDRLIGANRSLIPALGV